MQENTNSNDIRNIAIIAHVDHGKTTLVDAMLHYTGAIKADAGSMDSNSIEQERGITIYAKNASLTYKGHKINIVDTPGHADFGSEVERVLRSIDTVLLLVDAQEGPMPQTRFVLKKSLELGLNPIIIMNKLDKPAADPHKVHDEILELFIELGAHDSQLDFPVVYAIGRDAVAKKELTDEFVNLDPLFDMIVSHIEPAKPSREDDVFIAQPFNLAYDNFLGRMALCRVWNGSMEINKTVHILNADKAPRTGKIIKIYSFVGQSKVEVEKASVGDIVMVAGLTDIYIGETITSDPTVEPLKTIGIDEPTIALNFLVNNSPFAGKDGKYVTSRQIRDRLEKELEVNVGLKVDFDNASGDTFKVYGRGELHIAVLLEQMRREGFEVQVSNPEVITKMVDNRLNEPFEEVVIDVPQEFSGAVIEKLGKRKGIMTQMSERNGISRLVFEMPTRGLLGYRGQFTIDTKGEGILSSRFIEFRQHVGVIEKREVGSMVSMENGKALTFALGNLQTRGVLYIIAQTEVYAGMVVGNTSKGEEMEVNPTKAKQLTNMRASGTDDAILLVPPYTITIERGLEIMQDDEYLEITPNNVRLRKKYLTKTDREMAKKKAQ
ncbi:translational GTPase TypA [Candidatus Parcubacteria bacterium]|nr:translational GTPase TypA [Candidatus Parcubacteria bacterium]